MRGSGNIVGAHAAADALEHIHMFLCAQDVIAEKHGLEMLVAVSFSVLSQIHKIGNPLFIIDVFHGGGMIITVAEFVVGKNAVESGEFFQEGASCFSRHRTENAVAGELMGYDIDGADAIAVKVKAQSIAFPPEIRGVIRGTVVKKKIAEAVGYESGVVKFESLGDVGMMADDGGGSGINEAPAVFTHARRREGKMFLAVVDESENKASGIFFTGDGGGQGNRGEGVGAGAADTCLTNIVHGGGKDA